MTEQLNWTELISNNAPTFISAFGNLRLLSLCWISLAKGLWILLIFLKIRFYYNYILIYGYNTIQYHILASLIFSNFYLFICALIFTVSFLLLAVLSFGSYLHGLSFSILFIFIYVPLDLKWIFCSEHIFVSFFKIHSVDLCLLTGELYPFTLITHMEEILGHFPICFLYAL